jgi:hypothetical protein
MDTIVKHFLAPRPRPFIRRLVVSLSEASLLPALDALLPSLSLSSSSPSALVKVGSYPFVDQENMTVISLESSVQTSVEVALSAFLALIPPESVVRVERD